MGSTKHEPISKGVNPGGAAQIGLVQGSRRAIEPLYEGRGLKAPMVSDTRHKAGSQGTHR